MPLATRSAHARVADAAVERRADVHGHRPADAELADVRDRARASTCSPPAAPSSSQQSAVVAELGPRFRIRYRTTCARSTGAVARADAADSGAADPVMTVGNRFLELQTGLTQ
jgi:hypothetical protein